MAVRDAAQACGGGRGPRGACVIVLQKKRLAIAPRMPRASLVGLLGELGPKGRRAIPPQPTLPYQQLHPPPSSYSSSSPFNLSPFGQPLMNDCQSADEPPLPNNTSGWANFNTNVSKLVLPTESGSSKPYPAVGGPDSTRDQNNTRFTYPPASVSRNGWSRSGQDLANHAHSAHRPPASPPEAPPPVGEKRGGEEPAAIGHPGDEEGANLSIPQRMVRDANQVICSSWINWLLIFVPVGIAFGALMRSKGDHSPISPNIVFAVNAVAIVPLAYLLCVATESVAAKVGDTLGALLNVTFGNAVELIIFIIALSAKQIRIVQASLLGSILANLLLIMGMCFLFGGLRFREQVREFGMTLLYR